MSSRVSDDLTVIRDALLKANRRGVIVGPERIRVFDSLDSLAVRLRERDEAERLKAIEVHAYWNAKRLWAEACEELDAERAVSRTLREALDRIEPLVEMQFDGHGTDEDFYTKTRALNEVLDIVRAALGSVRSGQTAEPPERDEACLFSEPMPCEKPDCPCGKLTIGTERPPEHVFRAFRALHGIPEPASPVPAVEASGRNEAEEAERLLSQIRTYVSMGGPLFTAARQELIGWINDYFDLHGPDPKPSSSERSGEAGNG